MSSRRFVWVAVALGLLVHARSLDVFFYQDNFDFLGDLGRSPDVGAWLLQPHVDHVQLVPKLFYLAFLRAFGPTAVPWHVLMLLVHALNVLLLARVLGRAPVSDRARGAALVLFAVTTVFHECLYWVAAINVSLCLLFVLATVLAAPRRTWLCAAFALLAGLCASTAAGVVALAPLFVWIDGGRTRAAARRAALAGAACALGTAGWLALGRSGHALAQLDVLGGLRLTLVSLFVRLPGRFFTGGPLPAAVAATIMALAIGLAVRRRERRAHALFALAWMAGFTWLTLAFRTWLGDVVFVSRYQLFPAAGFVWLLALAIDDALDALRPRVPSRALEGGLAVVVLAVVAAQAFAATVVHRRWLERTEALGQAHAEIRQGLHDALASGEPLRLPDFAVGGGEGYRPSLRGMVGYLLPRAEQDRLRFEGTGRDAVDPRLQPLVRDVAQGRHNWMAWLDDLSVQPAPCTAPAATVPAAQLLPVQERGNFTPVGDALRIEPFGQGQAPLLRTDRLTTVPAVLWGRFGSKGPGELLLLPIGDGVPSGLGARLRLPPDETVCLAIDLALAARGRLASVRALELRVTNELTSYEIGPFVLEPEGLVAAGPGPVAQQ